MTLGDMDKLPWKYVGPDSYTKEMDHGWVKIHFDAKTKRAAVTAHVVNENGSEETHQLIGEPCDRLLAAKFRADVILRNMLLDRRLKKSP